MLSVVFEGIWFFFFYYDFLSNPFKLLLISIWFACFVSLTSSASFVIIHCDFSSVYFLYACLCYFYFILFGVITYYL